MRIFCISGCLAVPINPDKWSFTVLGERPVPVSLCRPQITHGLTLDRNQAYTVRTWRLKITTMSGPKDENYLTSLLYKKLISYRVVNTANNLYTNHCFIAKWSLFFVRSTSHRMHYADRKLNF